jgi:hypothetical protein
VTIGPVSQCSTCARFQSPFASVTSLRSRLKQGATCAAFPDGIPEDILRNLVDHRNPVKGDHGLRWESNGQPFPVESFEEE